ncbi:MAG: hypothetical protein WC648_05150 [Candidatus Paceibacterota bacterium]|jgi:hypothetical protein
MPKLTLDEEIPYVCQEDGGVVQEIFEEEKAKKRNEKPPKNTLDLDVDQILIFAQSLQIDQHPSLKSTLLQLKTYGKKALIIEVISIIKLFLQDKK